MKNFAFLILTLPVLAACDGRGGSYSHKDLDDLPFATDSLPGRFHAVASKGPASKQFCNELIGTVIAPIDFEEPEVIYQGVAIYKHKETGDPFIGVSFRTDRSPVFTLYTCAWPIQTK